MLDKLKALFHNDQPEVRVDAPVDTKKHPAHLIQRDANGRRVYYELHIADAPDVEGRWQWLARVCSSAPTKEGRGSSVSYAQAVSDGGSWAQRVVREIVKA